MDKKRCRTAFFSILLAGATWAVEPPSNPTGKALHVVSPIPWAFSLDWTLVLVPRELGWDGDWRTWLSVDQETGKPRARKIPGATVVVVDRFLDERQERALELNTSWAPVLARSFQLGWQSPYGAQVLGEFMGMTAANMRAPSIPSVFYNCLIPYWVQQEGWESSTGIKVTATSSPKPMILYPGRR